MSPRSSVHYLKREGIIQLCNLLCPKPVKRIKDLADGEALQKAIQFYIPEFDCLDASNLEDKSQVENFSELSKLQNVSKEHENPEDKPQVGNISELNKLQNVSREHEDPENEFVTDIKDVKDSHPAKNENILKFNYIQKFIDDCYKIESKNIILYEKCTKSCELELTITAIFVLCEIVQHLLKMKKDKDVLNTMCHLDIKYQVELEECFNLFISERENLSRQVIEKLLSKGARNVSPLVTPRRTSLRLNKKKLMDPSTPSEDVFINSPLKSFFESPIFKKEDILVKQKEIEILKKTLDFGEQESLELHFKLSDVVKESKEKDRVIKELQKQVAQLKEEINFLQNLCESEKAEKNELTSQVQKSEENNHFLTEQIISRNKEILKLEASLEEKKLMTALKRKEQMKSSVRDENIILKASYNKIKSLNEENEELKKNLKSLQGANDMLKKQLQEEILSDLKVNKSPENLNESYEERWNDLAVKRKDEENMKSVFEADYKSLMSDLNEKKLKEEMQLEEIESLKIKNKELLEENENLKKESRKTNRLSASPTKVSSVATMTMPELSTEPDTTTEGERFRSTLNQPNCVEHCPLSEESFTLNNSYDPNTYEHSVVCLGPEIIPEKAPEGILWKNYDTEKDNICDINLGFNSVVSENSHLGMISENAETDVLLGQENKYVLGNLNFNLFLNELKKLTKNGSFQKVLQVFGKCQNEINGTTKSTRLDLQELLKVITECVCVAVALNSESSFGKLQDKSCSTDESYCIQIDPFKQKLDDITREHEMELKKSKKVLEEFENERNRTKAENGTLQLKLLEKTRMCEDLQRKYEEAKFDLDNKSRKYNELKSLIKRIMGAKKTLETEFELLKRKTVSLYKEKIRALKKIKALEDQQQEMAENNSAINESTEFEDGPLPDNGMAKVTFVLKSKVRCITSQDTNNESILSDAFHNSLKCVNEDDYRFQSSLGLKNTEYQDGRVEEIKRRNSLLRLHLQSTYATEADLPIGHEDLYVKDDEKNLEENCSKKRKLADTEFEVSSQCVTKTPIRKAKKRFQTPPSLRKLLQSRQKRTFTSKLKH